MWTPGSTLTVSYGVTNPDPADQFADYTLTSDRSWPGLPISGNVQVPGQGGADIVVQVAVPDTAAHGLNTLSLHVTLRDSGTPLDCSNHLHDLATAALGSLALMELLADGVSLTWQAPGAADEPALVERGDASGWSVIGSADEVGSGVFRFLDASARRGATYSYRLVSARDRTRLLTAVATVTIPEQVAFALQILSANPSDAGWSLALDLPRAGIAHLTLFDVAGRRIESRDARLDAAGRAIVSLGAGSRPAPGVYTAVVRFHGERRIARLVRFP